MIYHSILKFYIINRYVIVDTINMSYDINDKFGSKVGSIEKDSELLHGSGSYTVKDRYGFSIGRIIQSPTSNGIIGIILWIFLVTIGIGFLLFWLAYRRQKSALILLPLIALLTILLAKGSGAFGQIILLGLVEALICLLLYSSIQLSWKAIAKTVAGLLIVVGLIMVFTYRESIEDETFLGSMLFFTMQIGYLVGLAKVLLGRFHADSTGFKIWFLALSCLFFAIGGVYSNFAHYNFGYLFVDYLFINGIIYTGVSLSFALFAYVITFVMAFPLLFLVPRIQKGIKDW